MLASSKEQSRRRRNVGAHVEIVRRQDITQVQVFPAGHASEYPSDPVDDERDVVTPGKLLEIVDNSGSTGLEGFYLRIPLSASKAFGEIIRTFSTFAVVWFANCITWSGTDALDTAFLYHVTLEELIHGTSQPHGVIDLDSSRLQFLGNRSIFLFPLIFMNI